MESMQNNVPFYKEQIDKINDFLNHNFDKDFFEDLEKLIEDIVLKTKSIIPELANINDQDLENFFENFSTKIFEPTFDNPNEAIKIAGDFFKSINPAYEQIYYNLLQNKELKFQIGGNFLDSFEDYIILNNNYNDVITIVHEVVHHFNNDNPTFLTQLLTECDSISYEQLACEYVKNIYGASVPINAIRILKLFTDDPYDFITAWKVISKLHSENKLNIQDLEKYYESLPNDSLEKKALDNNSLNHLATFADHFPHEYSYDIGFLISCYTYTHSIEKDNKALKALTDVMSRGKGLDNEVLNILEDAGIPIVKDGKLSLKGDNASIITDAYLKVLLNVDFSILDTIDKSQEISKIA